MRRITPPSVLQILALAALVIAIPAVASAHCDTLDGPVVVDARAALAAGDVTPVLKWVQSDDEPAIREAFARTVAVRGESEATRELADTWFLETLVRVHRAGEGASYEGLKPAGAVEPGIGAADHSLASDDVDALVDAVTAEVADGLRARFARVAAAREHKDHNIAAGRAWVAAYVEFIHYVEGLHTAAAGPQHDAASAHAGHAH